MEAMASGRSGEQRSKVLYWTAAVLAAIALAGALLVRRRRREQARWHPSKPRPLVPQAVLELQGLTEEQAMSRQLEGQDNAIRFKPRRSRREIWRSNILTIFNLSMVGLAAVQVLLDKPFDAILTTAVLALGIGLNVAQELWARGRLRKLELATRYRATVVREGRARSTDPGDIVRGDLLVLGPGDQIVVDGQLVGEGQIIVDESMLTGDPVQHARKPGDAVYAGSFCVAGHGACRAQKVGTERFVAALTGGEQEVQEELTPLEQTMGRVLRVLLVIVALLALLLLADYAGLALPFVHTDAFTSAASVIFGLAPSSLFLMILVNYAMGTAELARSGALVHRTRSVETLAQATVVCFAHAGVLTGADVRMEPLGPSTGRSRLAESRIRQILGDFARSTTLNSPLIHTLASEYPGNQRRIRDEVPFLSLYGWCAVAFDDADLRGVYVLGDPELIAANLSSDEIQPADERPKGRAVGFWRERLSQLGSVFTDSERAVSEREQVLGESREGDDTPVVREVSAATVEGQAKAFLHRLATQVRQALRRESGKPEDEVAATQDPVNEDRQATVQPIEEVVYSLAYRPEVVPLHTEGGMPHLPQDLIPLCRLRYSQQVRPEAIQTVRALSDAQVELKVFAPDAPERISTLLSQTGLKDEAVALLQAVSGPSMEEMDSGEFARAVDENTVFGRVTPEQAERVVSTLRDRGEVVAVVGDGANDLRAMRQAHLSIARQSSTPAALSLADIVLLEDSPQAFSRLLEKGQRIANGLLDILKLYLNQIAYLALLIVVIWGAGLGFPYQSKQGSLITIASVLLPSLGLSLLAAPGVLPRSRLGRLLGRFVAPAAIAISAAGVAIYLYFLGGAGKVEYAQLALTYMLTVSGLVLVVLLRPPGKRPIATGEGDAQRAGDPRLAAMVILLLLLVFVVASIPLADQVFGLKPLEQLSDYGVIALAVAAWAIVASLVWRLLPRGQH
jgi:magnesium-transporting ATPase (P-type)